MSFAINYVAPFAVDVVIYRYDTGQYWVPGSGGSWSGSFSYSTQKISLTQGSSQYADLYTTTISNSNFGSPGRIRISLHMSASPNTIVDVIDTYVLDVNEYPADATYHIQGNYTWTLAQDEFTFVCYLDNVRITSGITSPTLSILSRATGSAIYSVTPTEITAGTGVFKYDRTTGAGNRLSTGEAYVMVMGFTHRGSARSDAKLISRDE